MRKPSSVSIYDLPLSHIVAHTRTWARRLGPDAVISLNRPGHYGADYTCLQALITDKECVDTREGEQGFDEIYAVIRISLKRVMVELQPRITLPSIMLVSLDRLTEYDREDLAKLSYKAHVLGAARIKAATGERRVSWVDSAVDSDPVEWDDLSDQDMDSVSEGIDSLIAWRTILSW